jgi:3-hydroxy-9,10-secoandrosta-1,3,5(10)-triene-9,17-dione monooxygenase
VSGLASLTAMERGEAIERAAAFVPLLREAAGQAEVDRRMSDETMAALVAGDMFRLVQPARFGGHQLGAETFVRAMIEIARGDGSAGWITSLTAGHTKWAGFFPFEGQEEMYGADADLRFPLVVAPQGRAVPTDGGYLVTGAYDYVSGCDVCNWLGVNAIVPADAAGDPPRGLVSVVIRSDEYTIEDNWHVEAMAGTGSKRAVIEEVFVPARRVVLMGPDGEPVRRDVLDRPDEGFYRMPMMPFFACELGAVAVGIGRAFVEHFAERAVVKTSPFPPFGLLRDGESIQTRVGDAVGDLDRAERILTSIGREYDERAASGLDPTDLESRRMLLAVQGLVHDVCATVEQLGTVAGTSIVKEGEPLMRAWRDLIAVRTHYLLTRDRTANNVGRMVLGLEPQSRN